MNNVIPLPKPITTLNLLEIIAQLQQEISSLRDQLTALRADYERIKYAQDYDPDDDYYWP